MVGLLVEEARDALPLPNHPQCGRNDRFLIFTSTARALPRSGFVLRPISAALLWGIQDVQIAARCDTMTVLFERPGCKSRVA
ncbi:hypothetical protein AU467_27915 [Mesorhizobium loti]|uniref:Uncharacterized protein n=1 Tax=Rhizobium loti TaxID=381 RepID=A0A101KQ94_RHILI|nr:hypothetical protein AU467_27915 [Mesorhizobium loti]